MVENSHFANMSYQSSTKFHIPKERATEIAKKSHQIQKKLGVGIHGLSQEEWIDKNRKIDKKCKKLGIGIYSFTREQRREISIRGGRKGGKKASSITNYQKWMCLETGHISNPGGLSRYQKARGIDPSKRKRIE